MSNWVIIGPEKADWLIAYKDIVLFILMEKCPEQLLCVWFYNFLLVTKNQATVTCDFDVVFLFSAYNFIFVGRSNTKERGKKKSTPKPRL